MPLNNEVSARDMGYQVVQYISADVAYTDDGTAVTIGKLPAGSTILKAVSGVHVSTAFNAGTANVLDIGTTANDDLFGTDLAIGTATFVPLDEAVGGYVLTADTEITATPALTGTAATAGASKVFVAYLPNS